MTIILPMQQERGPKVVLVEDDDSIRDIIVFSLQSEFNFDVLECGNLEEARNYIQEYKTDIFLVICDHTLPEPDDSFELFKEILDRQLNIPFISTSASLVEDWPEYKEMKPYALVEKEQVIGVMNDAIRKAFTPDDAFAGNEYTSINFKSLVHLEGLSEDLYICLPTGRFLKIFSRGDKITDEDVEKYLQKKVINLYLKKLAQRWILRKVDEGMLAFVTDPFGKIDVVRPEGEELEGDKEGDLDSEEPRDLGFEKEFTEQVHERSAKVLNTMKKNKDILKLLKSLNTDSEDGKYIKNRINLVSTIACGLAKELEWGSDATFEKLIYVAHMHDIILFKHPELAKYNSIKEIEEADLDLKFHELVSEHPNIVADLIDKDDRAPAEASQIIRQHHELPDRSGFPNGINGPRIIPFAAMLHISISFAQYMMSNPQWKVKVFLNDNSEKFRGGVFNKITRAMGELFK
jgi:response regulator RpfG family c-di-GMP phosphodiesterase